MEDNFNLSSFQLTTTSDKRLFTEIINFVKRRKICLTVVENKVVLLNENNDKKTFKKEDNKWEEEISVPVVDLQCFNVYIRDNNNDDEDEDDDEDDKFDEIDDNDVYYDDEDVLNNRFLKLKLKGNKFKGDKNKSWSKTPSQIKMCQVVVDSVNGIRSFRNFELENNIKNSVKWHESEDERKELLSALLKESVIDKSITNNLAFIYIALKKLSLLKQIYKDNEMEAQFNEWFNVNDKNKTIRKIARFDQLFEELPAGCYGTCAIPISYLRTISDPNWESLVLQKLKN